MSDRASEPTGSGAAADHQIDDVLALLEPQKTARTG